MEFNSASSAWASKGQWQETSRQIRRAFALGSAMRGVADGVYSLATRLVESSSRRGEQLVEGNSASWALG